MTAPLVERALVGALLHLTARRVLDVAAGMTADDITDPQAQAVYSLAVEIAAAGTDPDPAVVVGAAQTRGIVGSAELPVFTGVVIDLHAQVPMPASVLHYRRSVLEASARRRVREAGLRLGQAADFGDLDTVTMVVAREADAVAAALARIDGPAVSP